jgi:hypothetical protein
MTMPGIQIYPVGCAGLPAHRDLPCYQNLVLNLTLDGDTDFIVQNRGGDPFRYRVGPGTLVAMAAPGFCGRKIYPLHTVEAMPNGRTILTARQQV